MYKFIVMSVIHAGWRRILLQVVGFPNSNVKTLTLHTDASYGLYAAALRR